MCEQRSIANPDGHQIVWMWGLLVLVPMLFWLKRYCIGSVSNRVAALLYLTLGGLWVVVGCSDAPDGRGWVDLVFGLVLVVLGLWLCSRGFGKARG